MIGPAGAQGFEAAPTIMGAKRDSEQVSELAVEVHSPRLGMLDGADHDVTQRLQALREQTEDDALAGAGVSADHDVATIGDAELDAAQEGVDRGRGVERFDRHVRAERVEFRP